MTNQKNIIIIGGGHNGLVCATYLAKAGHSVTVLEARDVVGGGAANHEFSSGYNVAGLAQVLHPLNPKIIKDLGLKSAGLVAVKAISTISLGLNGRHITLEADNVSGAGLSDGDVSAYKSFKKEFKRYAKALEPLSMNKPPRLKDMDFSDKITLAKIGWSLRFGLGASSMSEFMRLGGINIYDVLNEIIDDAQLKGAIAADAVIGHHMGPRTPNTVLTYLNRLRGETYGAHHLPQAGGANLVAALIKAATEAGVKIETGAKVEKIIIKDGKAVGVEMSGEQERLADLVVSNADAKTTFLKLVGAPELDAMFTKRIHTTRTNGTVAKFFIALDQLPNFPGLSDDELVNRLIIAPDMRYVEHAFNHVKYGEYSEVPVLEMTLPSLTDSFLAPKGHHIMSVSVSFAPYHLKSGWKMDKSAFSHKVLSLIEEYAPGISSRVVASELLTPQDIEREFNVTGGHWHHGELTIDQSFMMRPIHGTAQYNTPIDGLFLCGAAAHPGGGITGIPGHNAAKRILTMEKG